LNLVGVGGEAFDPPADLFDLPIGERPDGVPVPGGGVAMTNSESVSHQAPLTEQPPFFTGPVDANPKGSR
jgi:hypothetical protein